MVPDAFRPAAAHRHRKRHDRRPAGAARGARRARLRSVPQRRHPRQRHRRFACSRRLSVNDAARGGLPAHRPDRAGSCSTAAPASGCRCASTSPAQLEELVARFAAPGTDKLPTQFTRLRIERVAGKLVAARRRWRRWRRSRCWPAARSAPSLFAATDEAGIPDAVATQLAEIFATDIDFRRELQQGRDLLGRLRGADRRRRADHLGQRRRPAGSSPPSSSTRTRPTRRCGSRTATARAATSASTARASSARSSPARSSSRA